MQQIIFIKTENEEGGRSKKADDNQTLFLNY